MAARRLKGMVVQFTPSIDFLYEHYAYDIRERSGGGDGAHDFPVAAR
jgi:hypothetical protein